MERKELLEKVQSVFQEVLDDETLELTEEMKGSQIAGWDSFNQIATFSALEQNLNIEFSMEEVMEFSTIAKLLDVILEKSKSA